jgi:hypothetical protein
MSQHERRLFLRFAWGRDRLPSEKDFKEDMKIFPNLRSIFGLSFIFLEENYFTHNSSIRFFVFIDQILTCSYLTLKRVSLM